MGQSESTRPITPYSGPSRRQKSRGFTGETKSLRGELGALGAQAPLSQRPTHATVRSASKGPSPPAAAGLLLSHPPGPRTVRKHPSHYPLVGTLAAAKEIVITA